MLKDYFKIYKEHITKYGERTVLLMQCGGFYEVYQCEDKGYNIKELSQVMNVQYTKRNKSLPLSEQNPFMLGFPLTSLKKYKKILTDSGFTVAVYYQVETLKGKMERHKSGVFTYGTNIDEPENFFDSTVTTDEQIFENNIISIYCDEDNILSVARLDLTTGKGSVLVNPYEDEHQQLSLVHRFLQIYDSKEIVYFSRSTEFDSYLAENLDIDKSVLRKFDLSLQNSIDYQNEVLNRVYTVDNVVSPIEHLNLEKFPNLVTSWVILIDYVYSHVPKIIKNISLPDFFEEHSHLLLENNAVEQLNLISNNSLELNQKNKKFQSVYHVINNCSTSFGKRFLKSQLLKPLNSINAITERYDASTYLFDKSEEVELILSNVADIEKLQRKLLLSIITSQELHQLFSSYLEIEKLFSICDWSTSFLNKVPSVSKIIAELKRIFNFDLFAENVFFNTGVCEEVDLLIAEIDKDKKVISYLQEFLNNLVSVDEKKDTNCVKLETNERDGFYYTVSLKRSYAIKNQIDKMDSKIVEYQVDLTKLVFKQQPKSPIVKIFYNSDKFICI